MSIREHPNISDQVNIFSKQPGIINPACHRLVTFDMDGVVMQTVGIHADACKKEFDDFLEPSCQKKGCQSKPVCATPKILK